MAEPFAPTPFGDYLLVDLIGTGGMAEVFLAKSFGVEGFSRLVAIKRIKSQWLRDRRFVEMFIDEARLAVQLSDPNIAQIYELGAVDGQYYMAMEYVAGQSLEAVLQHFSKKRAAMPVTHAAFIITGLAAALEHAHRRTDTEGRPLKIVHRDVTPHNVLLSYDGEVKVVDFGIAKAENRLTKTEAGTLKGKFAYMSPETARGLPVDRRCDIFSAGILLWEALTGRRLFAGGDQFEQFDRVRAALVSPPSRVNTALPPWLDDICLKALAAEPEQRYQWASELGEALSRCLIEDRNIFGAPQFAAVMTDAFPAAVEAEKARLDALGRVAAPLAGRRPTIQCVSRDLTEIEHLGRSGTVILASSREAEAWARSLGSTTDPSGIAVPRDGETGLTVRRPEPTEPSAPGFHKASTAPVPGVARAQRATTTGQAFLFRLLSPRGARILVGILAALFLVLLGLVALTLGSTSTGRIDKSRTLSTTRPDGAPSISREQRRATQLRLSRLRAAAEATTDPALKKRLQRALLEVNGRLARGDYKGANLELNEALREAKAGP